MIMASLRFRRSSLCPLVSLSGNGRDCLDRHTPSALQASIEAAVQYFDVAQSGQLINVRPGVNAIRRFLIFSLRMVIYAVTMFVIVNFLLLREHFTLGIISLAVMPILIHCGLLLHKHRPMFARIQQEFGEMSSVMQENLAGTGRPRLRAGRFGSGSSITRSTFSMIDRLTRSGTTHSSFPSCSFSPACRSA